MVPILEGLQQQLDSQGSRNDFRWILIVYDVTLDLVDLTLRHVTGWFKQQLVNWVCTGNYNYWYMLDNHNEMLKVKILMEILCISFAIFI